MDFETSLKKAIICNSKLTLLLRDSDEIDQEKYESLEDLIKSINTIFSYQNFRLKFEQDMILIESSENFMFLSNLIENLMTYLDFLAENFKEIRAYDEDKLVSIQKTINTIEFISKFEMTKQIVLINGGVIIEMLNFIDNETISFSFETISFSHKILKIALNFSKNKLYEKIDFSPDYPLADALHLLSSLRQSNRLDGDGIQLVDLIEKNLKSNSIEECLKKFKINLQLNNDRVEDVVKDETFVDDLRSLSISLNNDSNTIFYWNLFKKHGSSAFFTKLLDFMLSILKVESLSENQGDDDEEETVHRVLRDLLEIIFQLVQKSYKFKQLFLDEGMLLIIIKFFEKIKLVELLLEAYVNILSKIMSIFFLLCRKLYYVDDVRPHVANTTYIFQVLKEAKDSFEKSSTKEESIGLQEKPIFRMFLICLAYLGKKFRVELLTIKDYEIIATRGFIPKTFKIMSKDFQSYSENITIEKIKWEFMNENNQFEEKEVSRLNAVGTTSTAIVTIVDALTCLRIIYTSDKQTKVAYENYKNFMKSILFYGLDIEKIICLACLKKYCITQESIRKDIFEDRKLVDYLSELYDLNKNLMNDEMKKRLNSAILDFFNSNGYKHEFLRRPNSSLELSFSNISIKN